MTVVVPILLLPKDVDLPVPRYQSAGAVAMDVYAAESKWLLARVPTTIRFGFALAIPEGYEGQIRGRSGLAKRGISCHLGTIDSDFRGEIMGLFTFVPDVAETDVKSAYQVDRGDRIAVIAPVTIVRMMVVDALPDTVRGAGGFGSTG